MIKNILNLFQKPSKPLLGRWGIKSDASMNIFYQNRDHCGDIICGKPVRHGDFEKENDVNKININKRI